jgi:hypothetical protein
VNDPTRVVRRLKDLVSDLDADIRAGSLFLYVHDLTKAGQAPGVSHYVIKSGSGLWTYPIPRAGLYAITVDSHQRGGVSI